MFFGTVFFSTLNGIYSFNFRIMFIVYVLLFLMVLIWGYSFIVVDIAISNGGTPLTIALYRFILASCSFLLIDLVLKIRNRGNRRNSNHIAKQKFTKQEWFYLFLASISGVSVYFFVLYSAVAYLGPSLPSFFDCLISPIIIAVLSLMLFKEKMTIIKAVGFIIASIGSYFLITGGNLTTLAPGNPNFLGLLFGLSAPFLWAIYSVSSKKLARTNKKSDFQILKYVSYLGLLELFILVILTNEISIFFEIFFNPILFFSAIYLGCLCYVLSYYIWNHSQKKLESSKVASFLYIQPFITLLFSIVLRIHETIMFWNIMGGFIVLIAVVIINSELRTEKLNGGKKAIKI